MAMSSVLPPPVFEKIDIPSDAMVRKLASPPAGKASRGRRRFEGLKNTGPTIEVDFPAELLRPSKANGRRGWEALREQLEKETASSKMMTRPSKNISNGNEDGNGSLDPKELHTFVKKLGANVPEDVLKKELDRDGDGKIDLNEFKAWWKILLPNKKETLPIVNTTKPPPMSEARLRRMSTASRMLSRGRSSSTYTYKDVRVAIKTSLRGKHQSRLRTRQTQQKRCPHSGYIYDRDVKIPFRWIR